MSRESSPNGQFWLPRQYHRTAYQGTDCLADLTGVANGDVIDGWFFSLPAGASAANGDSTAENAGIWTLTAVNESAGIRLGDPDNTLFVPTEHEVYYHAVADIDDSLANTAYSFGFSGSPGGTAMFALISYDGATDVWSAATDNGVDPVETTALVAGAIAGGVFHVLDIVVGASQVQYRIDGNIIATHSVAMTDVPSARVIAQSTDAGATAEVRVDFADAWQSGLNREG